MIGWLEGSCVDSVVEGEVDYEKIKHCDSSMVCHEYNCCSGSSFHWVSAVLAEFYNNMSNESS